MSRIVQLDDYRPNWRRPRIESPKYLDTIRRLPCILSQRQAEPAHIRYADFEWDKPETGMGKKPDDRWSLPLCPELHRLLSGAQHNNTERAWWSKFGVYDPLLVCKDLWDAFVDVQMRQISQGNRDAMIEDILALHCPTEPMYLELIARALRGRK